MAFRSARGRAFVLHLAAHCYVPRPALATTDAPCYDPAGAVVPGYYPCDPTAYITNCCASGWTCFSNALCVVTTASAAYPDLTMGAVERAMCTNPMWNNDICGDFCVTGSDNSAGEMVACGSNRFCCLGDYNAGLCSCTTAADGAPAGDSFVVNDGRAQTIIDDTATFTGSVSYLIALPTPSPTTPATPTHSNSLASGTGTATPTATGIQTPSPYPHKKSSTLAIALGVGVGGGVLALVGALYFAYRWWQRRHGGFRRGSFGHGSLGRGSLGRGSFRRGSFRRRTQPTDLALDGTALGEQMAMNSHSHSHYNRGGASHIDLQDEFRDIPLPPPQPRAGA